MVGCLPIPFKYVETVARVGWVLFLVMAGGIRVGVGGFFANPTDALPHPSC